MKRYALIIGYAGEPGAKDFLEGVDSDIEGWKTLLSSPNGGAWRADEIKIMRAPTSAAVSAELTMSKGKVDYALMVFTGHGAYSSLKSDTLLQLNKSETFESKKLDVATRQTVVLDCCRKDVDQKVQKSLVMDSVQILARTGFPNPQQARAAFDVAVKGCEPGIIVLNACNIGEYSYDDEFGRGGRYTFALLDTATKWRYPGSLSANKYAAFTVPEAHSKATDALAKDTRYAQNPKISKPRSGDYFPLCVWI
jgi:hypothetical protein